MRERATSPKLRRARSIRRVLSGTPHLVERVKGIEPSLLSAWELPIGRGQGVDLLVNVVVNGPQRPGLSWAKWHANGTAILAVIVSSVGGSDGGRVRQ